MRIFLLDQLLNKHDESDWASVYADEDELDPPDNVDWFLADGRVDVSRAIPVAVSAEMPIPDLSISETDNRLLVFDYESSRMQRLFANSNVQWIPLEVVASYDEDELEQIELVDEHRPLKIAMAHPLVRCRLAPGAKLARTGPKDRSVWFIDDIDNLSLYDDELAQSDLFMIEGSENTYCTLEFKKLAKELKVTGIKFERLSTLTC